jgi:hypothetical protein
VKLGGWALLALFWGAPGIAQTYTVPEEFWLAQRSGQALRAQPQLQQALVAYLQSERTRIRVHHQKRDESIAQAEELRGWLIAMGVEAARIELTDENPADLIKLEIMDLR